MTMEEAFKREKEEADRLLRAQRLEYENKIDELKKQVMETSMSQSMLSSIISSSGLVDSSFIPPQTLFEDLENTDQDPSDCSWSEQDYRLAWWTWKKWRYHRMTSLRVREESDRLTHARSSRLRNLYFIETTLCFCCLPS